MRALLEFYKVEIPRPILPGVILSVELNELVMGALVRDPNKRFASARDFSRLIFNYLLRHHADANLYLLQEFLDRHRPSFREKHSREHDGNDRRLWR